MNATKRSQLSKSLMVISLLAPSVALPLSIGDLQLESALNQKLKAEIKLQLASGEHPLDISARLATPERFDQAGIPWHAILSRLKFETVTHENGSVFIKISSKEPFNEPVLNFLLEVNWPEGTQYKEFTALVDPPSDMKPVPITTTSFVKTDQLPVEPDTDSQSADTVRGNVDTSSLSNDGQQYGPIKANQTLWSIANFIAHKQGVSTQKMLKALHKANPEAFINGSINSMRPGAILRIPDANAAEKPAVALAKPKNPPQSPAPAIEPIAKPKALELIAPVDTEIKDKPTSLTSAVSLPQAELNSALSSPVTSPIKTDDAPALALQARVDALEQQLALMHQLIVLKDQQMASLQTIAKAEPVKPAPAENDTDLSSYTILGLVLSLLSGITALLWYKKQYDQKLSQASMLAADQLFESVAQEAVLMQLQDQEQNFPSSSFTSNLNQPSANPIIDESPAETDAIEEADVYLTYSRYQQAAQLIEEAIKHHPELDNLKLKLFEIYLAGNNKAAFDLYAQQLAEQGYQQKPEFWQQVSELAEQINSSLSLFSDSPIIVESEDLNFDFDSLDMLSHNPDPETTSQIVSTSDDNDFNFDFEFESPKPSAAAEQTPDSMQLDWTMDDENETKIDLAKAYIEMGDFNMAREIIEEVIENGDQQQTLIAMKLLEQLE